MNRKETYLICLILFLGVCTLASAGDVVYTLWEDDNEKFWVRIQNDTDRSIRVDAILIVFYDDRGKPLDQRNVRCTGDCRLGSRDTRDFGPYAPPSGTASARVRNVKYTVE